jgi:hypothetical protein
MLHEPQQLIQHRTEQLGVAVTRLTCIKLVSGSIPGWITGSPELLCVFYSHSRSNCGIGLVPCKRTLTASPPPPILLSHLTLHNFAVET